MTYELVPSRLIGPGLGASRKRVSALLRCKEEPPVGAWSGVAIGSGVTVPSWHPPAPPSHPAPFNPNPSSHPTPFNPNPRSHPAPFNPPSHTPPPSTKPSLTPHPLQPQPSITPHPLQPQPFLTPHPLQPQPFLTPHPLQPQPSITPHALQPNPPSHPTPFNQTLPHTPPPSTPTLPHTPPPSTKPSITPHPLQPNPPSAAQERKPRRRHPAWVPTSGLATHRQAGSIRLPVISVKPRSDPAQTRGMWGSDQLKHVGCEEATSSNTQNVRKRPAQTRRT